MFWRVVILCGDEVLVIAHDKTIIKYPIKFFKNHTIKTTLNNYK
jgi:hypothetical protein